MLHSMLDGDDLTPRCSRAGCSSDAAVALRWRNPKIHTPDRVKTWLACAEHREYLTNFLRARSFPVESIDVETMPGVSDERQ